MITDIDSYLSYFDAVHRRSVRDIGLLPAEAEGWRPVGGERENAWDIGKLVGHMAASRLYFAGAYCNEGWVIDGWPEDTRRRETWVPCLERSASEFRRRLSGTPNEFLQRRIEMIDTPGATLSGWRLLMMMLEHDVHHRSQIDTYAGINGWPVADIFGRTAEAVTAQAEQQRQSAARRAYSG